MNPIRASRGRRRLTILATATAAAVALVGCAAGGPGATSAPPASSTAPASPSAVAPTEITFWTWLPDIQKTVDLFEAANPDIKVKVENVGVGVDEYTKIQNAVDAGSGGPDVAHMTYDAMPNFVLTGALADLTKSGGADIPKIFLPGVVSLVQRGDGIYGVPQDFGPGVMFYRADVFDSLGIDVPATWDDYAAAAKKIHQADPKQYITHIDPGLSDAAYMGLWQLDAKPWTVVDGTTISVNLETPEATRWADYWSKLNSDGLLTESVMGSDEWFKQLNDGVWVTWIVGAWGLQALTGNVPAGDGLWRVAPQPQWEAGGKATSQFGGSGTVVLEQSTKKEAATKFALWMNSDPAGVESLKNDQGLLPTTNAAWEDPAFLNEEISYLGGQPARQVFAESAKNSVVGWQWLPFQPYVGSVYKDTVGPAISGKTSIAEGFKEWQKRIVEYAQQQGFTVK